MPKPEHAPIELEEGWRFLQEHGLGPVEACLDSQKDSRSVHKPAEWMKLYTTVYLMCTQKVPAGFKTQLYEKVGEAMNQFLMRKTLPALRLQHDQFMLKELVRRWENHKNLVKWVTRVFGYLDRFKFKPDDNILELEKLGYKCFKDKVFDQMKGDIRNATLAMIRRERDGEKADISLLKSIVEIFVDMGMGQHVVYNDELENALLMETSAFYVKESARWAEEDTFPEFMKKAERCIADESRRSLAYLDDQTEGKLMQVCEHEILVAHQIRMLEKESSGLVVLLDNDMRDDLARLFRLYSRKNVNGLPRVAQIIRKYIEQQGVKIVEEHRNWIESEESVDPAVKATSGSESSRPDLLKSLLELHDRFDELGEVCFQRDPHFQRAMKEAFEFFVNQDMGKNSTAELFANHCDSLLNSTGIGSKMSDQEVDDSIEKFVKLFSYLQEKDVFQEFARKQLAKRLLLDRSHSDDAERSLIEKLKVSCGHHFVSKLNGMIQDMALSKEHQSRFKDWVCKESGAEGDDSSIPGVMIDGVDCTVRVLTTGYWPTYKDNNLRLPDELQRCVLLFREFYGTKTSQRILRWVHSLSKGIVETTAYVANEKIPTLELVVSVHQMCTLMLFNDCDKITFAQVRENLGIEDEETIRQCILSLVSKRFPLLLRSGKGKEFAPDEVLSLNTGFRPNKWRIMIPIPMAKISEEEKESAHQSVVEDRRHAIEAAIVRVMKKEKELEHQRLIAEVSRLLIPFFNPEPRYIKNRIEDLITREYMERDSDDQSRYRYVV
eukprot:CAMPEP_0184677804 /NCGR_PEP_ID=MMETSP0312-20130426/396_1 /TAXON_ID=31354 /ORGANISM="Compsopogon coeruleus, Strain SAG 36.94" /LENGTH=776 /DNA_ID=CAMNT_0027125917 /DNA_START=44 /DNA_END=2374 /DNA_ORIENTATION=+